jgi:hypothetical protein
MPAKVNHLAVIRSQNLKSTWRALEVLWALLSKLLNGIHFISIQNFREGLVRNIPLGNAKLPAVPSIESDQSIFFYGSKFTGGAVSVLHTGKYGIVNLSLNRPTDSEGILHEMWNSLESLHPIGIFAGEELELSEYHIEAVESGTLTPLALPLCEMAILAAKDSTVGKTRASEECRTPVGTKGILFRKPK